MIGRDGVGFWGKTGVTDGEQTEATPPRRSIGSVQSLTSLSGSRAFPDWPLVARKAARRGHVRSRRSNLHVTPAG
jgi:hypothetical protein